MKKEFKNVRGMHDLVPPASNFWLWLRDLIFNFSLLFQFQYIETPELEFGELFEKGTGLSSDIVQKELYYVQAVEEGRKIVLRPEGTPPAMRVYFNKGFHAQPQPVKFFYFSPMFRKERPQAGRFRRHTQWGTEIIGSAHPINDAEIINLGYQFFQKIGLKEIVLKINSIGCDKCRDNLKKVLKKYYHRQLKSLCKDCQRRYKLNILRMLDCKSKICQPFKENAPYLLDHICRECKNHFKKVLDYLETLQIPYELDNTLVRGLDYYTRTVFEWVEPSVGFSLGGGGRYDNLWKIFYKKEAPGVGQGIGIERIFNLLQERKLLKEKSKTPEIFLAQIGEEAKKSALKILNLLRKQKIPVIANLAKDNLSQQLEIANRLGVKYVLIIGEKEIQTDTILIREMKTGLQEEIHQEKLIEEIRKRI